MGSFVSGEFGLLPHLARLARLELKPEEESRYARDIAEILAYVERVRQVSVSQRPLVTTITGVQQILRADDSAPSELQKELLQCAPETERGMVAVPAVL